ncbi:hypothetical protein [Gordonia soli]|uniref:Uncharacterized protein n=1 Tax=Gordonia soli NBRC 108243 TaxID=1223545 RepID=M0QQK6_9ACTN|nr:hypothetical protein [Gordonia soli]GAC69732.1 hypothetical protein GS4_27_00100 [Gordonia soli NBRC 108243]
MTENRTTKAWLDGEGYELTVAAEQFRTGDTRVVREGERHYLTDPALDSCPADALVDTATPIVQRVNAVCRMADSGFRSLALAGNFAHSDGAVTNAVARAEIRARAFAGVVVTTRGGTVQPPGPSAAQRLATAAAADSEVAAIVAIMGSGGGQLGWVDLWKVYEHVRKYANQSAPSGKGKAIVRIGWATTQEVEDFEASANHPQLSGPEARHAYRSSSPSGNKIELREGRDLINRLVRSVVDDVL